MVKQVSVNQHIVLLLAYSTVSMDVTSLSVSPQYEA